jgi:ATP-binding cassette, subfamily C (CFTR/MRP), member 1
VARAIYSKKDLVLLDDVMSGLDAGTEDRMFNNLFGENGLFRAIGTTVIYATNGGMYLDVAPFSEELSNDESSSTLVRSTYYCSR